MIIQHNMTAMGLFNSGKRIEEKKIKILEKLSTGQRINRAGDDAAGMSISQKMKAQMVGVKKADENIQTGIS